TKSVGTTAFDSKFLKNDRVKFFEILGQVLNIITGVRCCESGICRFILLVLYYKILEFSTSRWKTCLKIYGTYSVRNLVKL
ncbi:hypothetical protein, partial [Leptospira interrogans]